MEILFAESSEEASCIVARRIGKQVRRKQNSILGLATGGTMESVYRELAHWSKCEDISYRDVQTFNLDEYLGLVGKHPRSYAAYMREKLFQNIDIPERQVHIPSGNLERWETTCVEYEKEIASAGGIDLQLLGIGRNGHIGFNEPGSSLGSRTRIKTLTKETVADNRRFFSSGEEVPRFVITMGIGTIMEARQVLLIATGEQKAEAVRAMVEGPVSASCPGSALQFHPHAVCVVDDAAGRLLQGRDYWKWVQENKKQVGQE